MGQAEAVLRNVGMASTPLTGAFDEGSIPFRFTTNNN